MEFVLKWEECCNQYFFHSLASPRSPPCRGLQCKCFLLVVITISVFDSSSRSALLHTSIHYAGINTYCTLSHMFVACFACTHLWPINIYHIQGSDTYQMSGNSAEPGLFISPERAQTLHTVVIIDYNSEPLNQLYIYTKLRCFMLHTWFRSVLLYYCKIPL